MLAMVTRPKPQGEILCEQLHHLGWDTIYFPTLAIMPISDLKLAHTIMNKLDQYDWLIFISPQAVYHALPLLPSTLPLSLKVATIGLSTADLLQENNISVTASPATEWTSEGLLALPVFQQMAGQNVLIVRGKGGRDLLAKTLAARGAIVDHWIVYERKLPKIDLAPYRQLLCNHEINIIICSSGEGLRNLLSLATEEDQRYLRQTPILVVSRRLKEYARSLGFDQIVVAKNASNESILTVLRERL